MTADTDHAATVIPAGELVRQNKTSPLCVPCETLTNLILRDDSRYLVLNIITDLRLGFLLATSQH